MRKGKLGVVFNAYAVLAFVFILFGQWLWCALLTGVVLVVEKDEWTSRQCFQALFLSLMYGVVDGIESSFTMFNSGFMSVVTAPLAVVGGVIGFLLWLPLFIFNIMALVRVSKGEEANVPLASKWAYKVFGYMPAVQQPQYQQPYAPAQAPQAGYPQQAPPMGAPMQQRPMAPPMPPQNPGMPPMQNQQTPPTAPPSAPS